MELELINPKKMQPSIVKLRIDLSGNIALTEAAKKHLKISVENGDKLNFFFEKVEKKRIFINISENGVIRLAPNGNGTGIKAYSQLVCRQIYQGLKIETKETQRFDISHPVEIENQTYYEIVLNNK